jgi:hypothetical protein
MKNKREKALAKKLKLIPLKNTKMVKAMCIAKRLMKILRDRVFFKVNIDLLIQKEFNKVYISVQLKGGITM